MMIHKQFQSSRGHNSTNVQFNIDHNGQTVLISDIKLNNKYKRGLPLSVHLEYDQDNNEWKLCTYSNKKDLQEKSIRVRQYLDSTLAGDIVKKLLEVKEKESAKFGLQNPVL